MKFADVVGGGGGGRRPDVIMADSCGGGTGPRKAVDVCGPCGTRAAKVPSWHHSAGSPTVAGEEP
jgi:hypothetical protein